MVQKLIDQKLIDQKLIDQIREALEEQPTRFRIGLDHKQSKAIAVVLVIALVVSVGFFLLSRPKTEHLPVSAPAIVEKRSVVVDVAGKVLHPGVYTLPEGSRAIDAITAAGGISPGVHSENINLAHVLTDGEQILVGEIAVAAGLLDINSASAEELDRLPGVGPVMAQRIISWRKAHGRFRTIDQLKEVPGVGAAKFADLKSLIRV